VLGRLNSTPIFTKHTFAERLAHTSPLSPPRPTSRLHSAQRAAPRDAAQRMSSESAAGECPHFLSRTILFRGLNKRAPASPFADPLPALAQTPCLLTSRTFRTWTPRARMASASSTTRCETSAPFLLGRTALLSSRQSRAPLRARGSPPCPPPHRRWSVPLSALAGVPLRDEAAGVGRGAAGGRDARGDPLQGGRAGRRVRADRRQARAQQRIRPLLPLHAHC
jgi:hypothetical protein